MMIGRIEYEVSYHGEGNNASFDLAEKVYYTIVKAMPNLLNDKPEKTVPAFDPGIYRLEPKKKKTSRWWWSSLILLVVIILISLGFLTKGVLAINSTNDASGEKISFIEQIKNLLVNPEKQIKGEADNRINFLLSGIGGAGHDGAYLADTIIFVSFKPSTKEVAMISIPRDLYVEIPEFGWRKINNATAFGLNSDYPGGDDGLLTDVVEQVIGLPIHYYARIDFEGFRQAIDDLGGVDVEVANSFTDYQYPDYQHGYQTITFVKGPAHLTGERALQYVRSRHGSNGEGSDFARSERQQKVLFAAKDKLLSINTIVNPTKIVSMLDDLGDHNQTNLQVWEIARLAKLVSGVTPDSIITEVLETGPDGILASETTIDGAYILRPKSGDYAEIQYLAKNIFKTSTITRENARIEIQNGTKEAGLAAKTAAELEGLHYNVISVGNTPTKQAIAKTTIYDLTGGEKPYTIASLKNYLKADVTANLPAFMTPGDLNLNNLTNSVANANITTNETGVDILIILGPDLEQPAAVSLVDQRNHGL